MARHAHEIPITDAVGTSTMIHYHGGPITPIGVAESVWKCRHAFISFENPEQLPLAAKICQSFALDNGAYSAWSSGKPLDIDAYAQWVRKWMHHPRFDWCVIPDVIDGSESDNVAMIARWRETGIPFHCSVPVWHLHESLDRLQYMTVAWPRIAIGSSGAYATVGSQQWWQRISDAMAVVCDAEGRPKSKLHGLRMLNPDIFSRLPLSSADSTNIARNQSRESGKYQMTKGMAAVVMASRIEHTQSADVWGFWRNPGTLTLELAEEDIPR